MEYAVDLSGIHVDMLFNCPFLECIWKVSVCDVAAVLLVVMAAT
jgi:hypothetical protein